MANGDLIPIIVPIVVMPAVENNVIQHLPATIIRVVFHIFLSCRLDDVAMNAVFCVSPAPIFNACLNRFF